ncbi:MAG: DUF4174 domain-containing protein [Pseudomonadota bacterium]
MRTLVAMLAAVALSSPSWAQDDTETVSDPPLITEAETLDPFLWVARPVIVFADAPNDPRFLEQIGLLEARKEELFTRDVVVITDTDPAAGSELRRQLRPRGFQLVVIGKDGQVKLRKPAPWSVREITRQIDKFPLRRQEIREGKQAAGAG